jgi:hypothetical protein
MSAEIFLLPVYWLATPVTGGGGGGDGRKERKAGKRKQKEERAKKSETRTVWRQINPPICGS